MSFSAWKLALLRSWKGQSEDNISLAAAGVAFYGLVALVPLLGAIVIGYGFAADPQSVLQTMKSLSPLLPADVAKLIGDQLMSIVQSSGSKKGLGLALSLAVALWGARNAATSIIAAINMAFEVEETRNTIRLNLLALLLTAGGVAMSVFALLAMTALGYLETLLPQLPDALVVAGKFLSYFALFLGACAGAATLYRFAPSRHQAKWQWFSPGSLLAALLWLALTFGFGFYVAHFGNYDRTYGTLATIVILITWMYLSVYVFLLGAELNSALEKQAIKVPGGDASSDDDDADRRCFDEPHFDRSGALSDFAGLGANSRPDLHASNLPPSIAKIYAVSRLTSRSGRLAGLAPVGFVSAALSSLGLALLKKRGREGAGAILVVCAVGLSLLKRKG